MSNPLDQLPFLAAAARIMYALVECELRKTSA
jgi:hypothetical protein